MSSDSRTLYWGDTHANLRTRHFDRIADSFAAARDHLDFWPVAYYPFAMENVGFEAESVGRRPAFAEEWRIINEQTARWNEPGRFVTYPGYEWHGDRHRWGDHNVFYPTEGGPLDDAQTLAHLYENLRRHDAIAVPHHTAYQVGERGKDWAVFDERVSPFAEIYSIHGCSEGYGNPIVLERNMGMGPMVAGGTLQDGLARGRHVGIIASNDTHTGFAGHWGAGLMGCWAKELTRESLWEAFHARRVYGVTGDRIRLRFTVADLEMGSVGRGRPPYHIIAHVEGCDAIQRVELLRNNVVIGAHTRGYNAGASPVGPARYKLRAVFGWGPRPNAFADLTDRAWQLAMAVEGGQLRGVEKYWKDFGQQVDRMDSSGCSFRLTSGVSAVGAYVHPPFPGMGFELDGTPDTRLRFTINGRETSFTLREAREFPRVVADLDTAETFLRERYGATRERLTQNRQDTSALWHAAYKTLFSPAIHNGEFAGSFAWEDTPDRAGESWYYVRVIQNNGQAAWSSPVWVTPM